MLTTTIEQKIQSASQVSDHRLTHGNPFWADAMISSCKSYIKYVTIFFHFISFSAQANVIWKPGHWIFIQVKNERQCTILPKKSMYNPMDPPIINVIQARAFAMQCDFMTCVRLNMFR